MIKNRVSIVVLVVFLISAMMFSVSVQAYATSSFQLGKLQEKPSWAGSPGGPNGGGGGGDDDTTTTYVLNIEIDYMDGHAPTPDVLAYIESYYDERGISVIFYVEDADGYSDVVDDPTPKTGVTDEDFWAIEAVYNDNDKGYFDNWKWVLFGTTVESEDNVVGYCWVVIRGEDVVAGNYIFIADKAADDWAIGKGIEPYRAEAAVLMHEMGHSIGIGKVIRIGGITYEVYDPDSGSVMAYLTLANAKLDAWYYSDEYWATRNMKYYKEKVA